jgi:transcriptional regulator with XRE-family HTH domain
MRRRSEPAAAGVDNGSAALVGELLRNRRVSRGLTPEEVALAIRVGARHVLAVEEGRFADLPPQPYGRGLISAYATLLGLEPEELLRVCGPALAGEGSGQQASIFRYPARERFVWREWTVPFALAAVVASIVVTRVVLAPAPLEIVVPAGAPETAVPARPVQKPAAPAEPTPAVDQAPEQEVAAPGVRVVLRCEGTTWAEAAPDGAGPKRYELGPGQNLELTARERLSLSLGDAGVIRLSVNGRELGFIGFKGQAKPGLSFTAPKATPVAAPSGAAGD